MNIFDYRKAESLLTVPPYNQESSCLQNGWRGYLMRGTLLALGFGAYYLLSKKIDFASNGRRCFYALREYFPREKYREGKIIPRINLRSVGEVCPVCLGNREMGVRASCGHLLCVRCLVKYRKVLRTRSPPCPLCRAPFKIGRTGFKNLILDRVPQLGLVACPDHNGARKWIETLDFHRHVGVGGDDELSNRGSRVNFSNSWTKEGNFSVKNGVVWCFVMLTLIGVKLQVVHWAKLIEYGSALDFLIPLTVMPAIYIWCLYQTACVHTLRYE